MESPVPGLGRSVDCLPTGSRGPSPQTRHLAADTRIDLWGGLECTINRVGDDYFEQLARSGHHDRPDDLDRFAALGIRTLRYPVLWEQFAPEPGRPVDWAWADERLGRMRDLGIRPIVGLCHHGSGPRHVSLLDPRFPEELAAFARQVAERYPWVEDWTPVNEPLTTARFSALYGHWYPHARDGRSFARAVATQCRGVQQAMRAIREVNPAARLIQTEDLARTRSTPPLAYQADYDNQRRWLSLDLLCGRVGPKHPLWAHLWWLGLEGPDLFPLIEDPCPPDLIGFNYYLTSERFLDHRHERYPGLPRGGNGQHEYADLEVVRVLADGIAGPGALLREAWDRYGLPLAITEAHLGSTREEQVRWLAEVWRDVRATRQAGVDVRAVTVWSLLGSFDWHCLLTRREDHYEPGAFDVRAPAPRPTAIAKMARDLAAGREPDHPVLDTPGWWRRPERILYPPLDADGRPAPMPRPTRSGRSPRPLLLIGAGPLAEAVGQHCRSRALPVRTLDDPRQRSTDLADLLDRVAPWAVIDVTGAGDPSAARHLPFDPAAVAARDLPLLACSAPDVFDGRKGEPYVEADAPAPAASAGRWRAARDAATLEGNPGALLLRVGPILGPNGLLRGTTRQTPGDLVTPVPLADFVTTALDLLVDGEQGLWHLGGDPQPWGGVPPGPSSRCLALGSRRGTPLPRRAPAGRAA